MSAGTDAVIVGAGPIGLAIAWCAARQGLRVVVADPAPGRGAAWAAAGMLAPVTEAHVGEERLLALNLEAARRWPAFVEALEEAAGRVIGYRDDGTVIVARDRDDLEAVEELRRSQQQLGLDVQRLSSRDLRALEPGLAPSVRGGLLVAGDHAVDPRALSAALVVAAERAGVRLERQAAAAVVVEGGHAVGIRLADGSERRAARVVLAAGAWSAGLPGVPPGVAPVRPVKGQIVYLRHTAGPPIATRNLRGLEVYLAPRADGRLAVGATVEELGFDLRPTAGAVHELLRRARELLPGVDELEFDEVVVGLRPGTPDNAPVLGAAELDGLVVATGHFRNGILLTPLSGEAVAELLATGRAPAVLDGFGPRRFGAVSAA